HLHRAWRGAQRAERVRLGDGGDSISADGAVLTSGDLVERERAFCVERDARAVRRGNDHRRRAARWRRGLRSCLLGAGVLNLRRAEALRATADENDVDVIVRNELADRPAIHRAVLQANDVGWLL